MKRRMATRKEVQAWKRWLRQSHGTAVPRGLTLWRWEGAYVFYGVLLGSLRDAKLWGDPDSDFPFLTLTIFPRVQTVSRILMDRPWRVRGARAYQRLETQLQRASQEGRLWWGVESLVQRPWIT